MCIGVGMTSRGGVQHEPKLIQYTTRTMLRAVGYSLSPLLSVVMILGSISWIYSALSLGSFPSGSSASVFYSLAWAFPSRLTSCSVLSWRDLSFVHGFFTDVLARVCRASLPQGTEFNSFLDRHDSCHLVSLLFSALYLQL